MDKIRDIWEGKNQSFLRLNMKLGGSSVNNFPQGTKFWHVEKVPAQKNRPGSIISKLRVLKAGSVTFLKNLFHVWSMCAYHNMCVEVSRQHAEVGSFLLMCGSQEQNWEVRLGSRHLPPPALLTGLACWFKWSLFCPRVRLWIIHNDFSQFSVNFCICEIEFARSWNLRSARLFSFYKKQRSFTRQEGSVQLLPGIWAVMSSGGRQPSPSHVYEVLFHGVCTRDGEALNHL